MSNNLRIGLAFILVVVGLFGESTIGWFKDNVEVVNEPEVKITEPSLENKELVRPISEIDFSKEDAKLVSCYFLEVADVVEDDSQVIKTTETFSNFNLMSGLLHFNTKFAGKYDGLGDAVESAVQNTIGLDNQALTPDKRKDLVEILEAIAWSANQ
jgi:hypothetical protein|tara:strand:+ start:6310 stop:6777 length:468 start_codon:yes stop_codon:yes gene_type:complete